MKKHICRILSVILVVCLMVIPANAASDVVTVDAVAVPLPAFTGTLPSVAPIGISKSISCASENYFVLGVDYYVTKGKTTLNVESCTWSPQACDIIIGFYPCDDSSGHGPYGVRFSGGSVTNKTIRSIYVPTGMYWLYVYNAGTRDITGTINYSVSN